MFIKYLLKSFIGGKFGITVMFIAAVGLIGCGYQLVGNNPPLPESAQTIAIAPIQNQTFQGELDTRLMKHLKRLIRNNASVYLVTPEDADLLLKITLTELKTEHTSLSSDGLTIELNVTLHGTIVLEDQRNEGKKVWEEKEFGARSSVSYEKGEESTGMTVFTINRGMDQITEVFSKKIYERIFFNF